MMHNRSVDTGVVLLLCCCYISILGRTRRPAAWRLIGEGRASLCFYLYLPTVRLFIDFPSLFNFFYIICSQLFYFIFFLDNICTSYVFGCKLLHIL